MKTINKKSVLETCKKLVQVRIDNAQEAMNSAHESTLNEEKSSSGDKFETGRAMGHINRDMFAKQWDQANRDMEFLNSIQPNKHHSEVEIGTLVYTKDKLFFIISHSSFIAAIISSTLLYSVPVRITKIPLSNVCSRFAAT